MKMIYFLDITKKDKEDESSYDEKDHLIPTTHYHLRGHLSLKASEFLFFRYHVSSENHASLVF